MNGSEMRAARKKVAMTQHELAQRLGVSRKTVVGWEQSTDPLDEGVVLQVRRVTGQIRLIENTFSVFDPTPRGSYAVWGRRIQEVPSATAARLVTGATLLYGEFRRRDHAYRWCSALQASADPRRSRKQIRETNEEVRRMREVE